MKRIILIIGLLLMVGNVNAICPCSGEVPCNETVIDYNSTHELVIQSTYLCGDVNGDGRIVPAQDGRLLRMGIFNCTPPIITYTFRQKMINHTINLTSSYNGFIAYNQDIEHYYYSSHLLKMGRVGFPMAEIFRGFTEFDTSTIPSNVNIINITFKYKGSTHNIGCNITNMTIQPSISLPENIYNDIGAYTIYTNVSVFPIVGENQSINLGINAINDLQIAINDSNWFSIGIKSVNESNIATSEIYSPLVSLMIEYQAPAEQERDELNIMFHEYNMHINIITNPLEYIVTKLNTQVGTNIIRPQRSDMYD